MVDFSQSDWSNIANEALHMYHMLNELGWTNYRMPVRPRRWRPTFYGDFPVPGTEQPWGGPLRTLEDEIYYVADVFRYGWGRGEHEDMATYAGPSSDIDAALRQLVDDDNDPFQPRFWFGAVDLQAAGFLPMLVTAGGAPVLTPENFLEDMFVMMPHLAHVVPRMYRFYVERTIRHNNIVDVIDAMVQNNVPLPPGVTMQDIVATPYWVSAILGIPDMMRHDYWQRNWDVIFDEFQDAVQQMQGAEEGADFAVVTNAAGVQTVVDVTRPPDLG